MDVFPFQSYKNIKDKTIFWYLYKYLNNIIIIADKRFLLNQIKWSVENIKIYIWKIQWSVYKLTYTSIGLYY